MPYSQPIPLADMPPNAEARLATPGAGSSASRMDHQHPRLTSAATQTLNASSEATLVFTRLFDSKPSMVYNYEESAEGQPIVFKTKSWTTDANGKYTGCVVKAYRGSLVSIAVLGVGVNAFGGSASGVTFSYIALQSS